MDCLALIEHLNETCKRQLKAGVERPVVSLKQAQVLALRRVGKLDYEMKKTAFRAMNPIVRVIDPPVRKPAR